MSHFIDHGAPLPLGHLVEAVADSPLTQEARRFLGQEGVLERSLPEFRPRPQQLAAARMVARALELRRPAAIEAGTGTGKSLAYLVPAIAWAVRGKQTVVVSTHTHLLQAQLVADLARLQPVLAAEGLSYRYAALYGRSNYACEARAADTDALFRDGELVAALDWLRRTQTGLLDEMPLKPSPAVRAALTIPQDDCPGRKRCGWGSECWFYRAREAAQEAHIVVCNHALFCLDLTMGHLLPRWDAAVIDEAHQLQEVTREAFSWSLDAHRFRRLYRRIARSGLLTEQEREVWLQPLAEGFKRLLDLLGGLEPGRQAPPCPPLREAALELQSLLSPLSEHLADHEQGEWLAGRLDELGAHLLLLAGEEEVNLVFWIEDSALHAAPIDVSRRLQDSLWSGRPVVLTSATLAAGQGEGAWEAPERDLGFSTSLKLQVDSPFDWHRQLLYYLPTSIPRDLHDRDRYTRRHNGQPRYGNHEKALLYAAEIERVLSVTEGRAFILFTTRDVMTETYQLLQSRLPWSLCIQGQFSRAETTRWFREAPHPVLFATRGYWEGIDVPGAQLSCVIIDQIPYPHPADPLEQARRERLTRVEYQRQVQVPYAITHLRQAVGRLIRTVSDRGLAVLLDPRLRYTGHGAKILYALQGRPTVRTTLASGALSGVTRWLRRSNGEV